MILINDLLILPTEIVIRIIGLRSRVVCKEWRSLYPKCLPRQKYLRFVISLMELKCHIYDRLEFGLFPTLRSIYEPETRQIWSCVEMKELSEICPKCYPVQSDDDPIILLHYMPVHYTGCRCERYKQLLNVIHQMMLYNMNSGAAIIRYSS
jgi:hypothetical protein